MTETDGHARLKRAVGLPQVALFGLGSMLGAGIYGLIGEAAGELGSAIWIAFLVSMVAALLTVLLTGVGAALVAAVTTILVEGRRRGYEDRTRFIELRRERYSQLLRESDEHVRMLRRQHAAVIDRVINGDEAPEGSASELPSAS